MRISDWSSDVCSSDLKKSLGDEYEDLLSDFVMKHAQQVVRLARPDYNAVSSEARGMIDQSKAAPNEVLLLERDAHSNMRSEEHTSELQSLMRIPYAVFCLKKKKYTKKLPHTAST